MPITTAKDEPEEKSCFEKFVDSWKGLCTGEAFCVWNVFCCPFVLLYQFFRIYIFQCLGVLIFRFYDTFCCFCCRTFCQEDCYFYVDGDFPAEPKSLASREAPEKFESSELKGKTTMEVAKKVAWVRPKDFLEKYVHKHDKPKDGEDERMQLIADGIMPGDVVQGKLGDCWLLAALACMAEFPESIQNVFLTKGYNPQGKYRLRFWDTYHEKWITVTVDDRIPVNSENYEPLFAEPKGNELWVFLIEKAFAKYCQGYSNLSGGHTLWAFATMTGDVVFRIEWDAKKNAWARYNLKNKMKFDDRDPASLPACDRYVLSADTDRFDHVKMWNILKEYNKRNAVMSCGKSNKGEAKNDDLGIVAGHAYSLIEAVETEGFQLLKLRNPWGTFEWKGAWSDGDKMWDKHSGAKSDCNYHPDKDDGAFWIEYQDWKDNFDTIQICDRTTKGDLSLDVREDEGCCGVVKGCCIGAAEFWFCCEGFRTIYCGTRTSSEIVKPTYCCGMCESDEGKAWKAESAYK